PNFLFAAAPCSPPPTDPHESTLALQLDVQSAEAPKPAASLQG
ncbi:MAG: hypothetical protein ACI855_005417, partial [Myxococcota bacterium]